MKRDFDPNLPIYLQVIEEIKKEIFANKYLPGQKVASVREMALDYGVNPNTIQKALSELERENLLHSKRSSGRFVSEDIELIEKLKNDLLIKKITLFVNEMKELGYNKNKIIELIMELDEN